MMTKENIIDNIARLNSETWRDREEVRMEIGKLLSELKKALEQQPCDDYVSRAELMKLYYESRPTLATHVYEFGEKLQALPPVIPTQSKWHLVKDELPRKFSFVNCTCHSLIDDREDWVIETCYFPQYPNSPYSDWGNIPMLNNGECEVIAWMYRDIPKPYKEK